MIDLQGVRTVFESLGSQDLPEVLLTLLFEHIPWFLVLEFILFAIVLLGLVRHAYFHANWAPPYYPRVTCIITCYSEGRDVQKTIRSIADQIYPGLIDIFVMIDGSVRNKDTLEAAREMIPEIKSKPNVKMLVIPKKQRGGAVSSLNLGLALAQGEVIMALDGDTSFDNDMVSKAVRHFSDPNVVAVGGALRVRNRMTNLCTMFQGLEYLVGIHATRTGLSAFNIVNTISGAFGVFRTDIVRKVGGWSSGSSQDLDLTFRLNAYFGRYKKLRMVFDAEAIGHTNVPETWKSLFRQRIRWDGDLVYIYLRKHIALFTPSMLGWSGLLFQAFIGLFISTVMPVLTVAFLTWAFFALPIEGFLAWITAMYVYYFFLSVLIYAFFLSFVSERPKYDLLYIPFLVGYPVYSLVLRFVSAFAIVWNVVGRSHLDSSMAPWWVLRKGKY